MLIIELYSHSWMNFESQMWNILAFHIAIYTKLDDDINIFVGNGRNTLHGTSNHFIDNQKMQYLSNLLAIHPWH
jgi:hypothetical protein